MPSPFAKNGLCIDHKKHVSAKTLRIVLLNFKVHVDVSCPLIYELLALRQWTTHDKVHDLFFGEPCVINGTGFFIKQ